MKKKHCNSEVQKAIAKFAYCLGRHDATVKRVDDWESSFLFVLRSNEDIIKKYLRMGNRNFWREVQKARLAGVDNRDTRTQYFHSVLFDGNKLPTKKRVQSSQRRKEKEKDFDLDEFLNSDKSYYSDVV